MNLLILILPFVFAILLGAYIIPYIILITFKKRLFDPINSRKLHETRIPRLGGVVFVPVQCCLLAISIIVLYKVPLVADLVGDLGISTWIVFPMFLMLMCGLVVLYLVGLADDLIGVNNKTKFFIQLAL